MSKRNAWILELGNGQRAAVGERELVHLIHEPKTFAVPLTPAHCRRVLLWQQQVVPAMDLDILIAPGALDGAKRFAGIVGYQAHRSEPPRFGALLLAMPPRRVEVEDRQACALAAPRWREISLSCFDDGSGPIPILDLSLIFSGQLRRGANLQPPCGVKAEPALPLS